MRNLMNALLILFSLILTQSVVGSRLLEATDKQDNSAQKQEAPAASQGQTSSSAAVQSVTGCMVRSGQGFSLKTDHDNYPIETDQDLSQYVNKKIKVTGILEHHTGASASATSGSSAVITDIRLRMIASVVGDCNQPSK